MAKLMSKHEGGSGGGAPQKPKGGEVSPEGPADKRVRLKPPATLDPTLAGEFRKLSMGFGAGMRKYWGERVRDSKATPPLTQEAAIGLLLETKDDKGIYVGWTILKQNLKHIILPVAAHPSEKKVSFLIAAAKNSNPSIVASAFKAAAASKKVPGKVIELAEKRLENAGKEKPDLVSAATEFLEVVEFMREIAKGGEEELAATDKLLGLYASDWAERFSYLKPFVRRRHAHYMEKAIEAKPKVQARAISILRIFEKHDIIVDGTKEHVQVAVDALLEKGPEGWKGVLANEFVELKPQIAESRSFNRNLFLESVVRSCNPALVTHALDMMFELDQIPQEVVDAAEEVKCDPRVKAIAEDFLRTLQLIKDLDKSGEEQFAAAEELASKARLDKPGLKNVLLEFAEEMQDVSVAPGGSTPEESQLQKESAERILAMLADAEITA